MKEMRGVQKMKNVKSEIRGITLIALVITIIVSYDKKIKCSNINGFLFSKIKIKYSNIKNSTKRVLFFIA